MCKKTSNQNVSLGRTKELLKVLQYVCMPTKHHACGWMDSMNKANEAFRTILLVCRTTHYRFTVLGNVIQNAFPKILFLACCCLLQ